jgi:hypothetical protein
VKELFKIKSLLNKHGEDNKLILTLQLIGEFITTCILVFLIPFFTIFILGKKSKYLAETSLVSQIIDIWFNPLFIYPFMFLTSSFVTYFFFKKEFKFTRIIEMVFFENEAKLILTNRLGLKYKRITVNKSDFNVRILNESFQEIV